jgi:hypothetical protein
MKTLTEYENAGFNGIDASLETSLFEYGLIWHENDQDGDTKLIFGINYDGESYNQFDYGFYNEKEFTDLIESSWFNLDDILSFISNTKENWLNTNLGNRIFDCISYYGYENIFGSSYGGFIIERK